MCECPRIWVESNDLDRGIKLLQQRSKRARYTTDIEYIVSDPVVVQITGFGPSSTDYVDPAQDPRRPNKHN